MKLTSETSVWPLGSNEKKKKDFQKTFFFFLFNSNPSETDAFVSVGGGTASWHFTSKGGREWPGPWRRFLTPSGLVTVHGPPPTLWLHCAEHGAGRYFPTGPGSNHEKGISCVLLLCSQYFWTPGAEGFPHANQLSVLRGTSVLSYNSVQFWHLSTWSHCQMPQVRVSVRLDCPPPSPPQMPVWVLGCHLHFWMTELPTAPSSGLIIRYGAHRTQESGLFTRLSVSYVYYCYPDTAQRAGWKSCMAQGAWEGAHIFVPALDMLLSQHLQLSEPHLWGFYEGSLWLMRAGLIHHCPLVIGSNPSLLPSSEVGVFRF